ncbi:MAG: GGDEF domain-containing protein [Janthinobacterium lividum]
MARLGVAPTPRAYALWFTHHAGTNRELSRCLAGMLQSAVPVSPAAVDALHARFLAPQVQGTPDCGNEAREVGTVAQALLDQVAGSQAAMAVYGDTLEQWAQHLNEVPTASALLRGIATLTAETRKAAERNRELEQKLTTTAAHATRLRQSLDDAKREAMVDALTGIGNRRAFEAKLRSVTSLLPVGAALPISVVMLDVDHFKQFNDRHGHATGDLVLRLVGRLLTEIATSRDVMARYGGEEFAMLLVGADLKAAIVRASAICQTLGTRRLVRKGSTQEIGSITASFGIAQHRPGETIDAVVERADASLYLAKSLGRNRVCSETELPSAVLTRTGA